MSGVGGTSTDIVAAEQTRRAVIPERARHMGAHTRAHAHAHARARTHTLQSRRCPLPHESTLHSHSAQVSDALCRQLERRKARAGTNSLRLRACVRASERAARAAPRVRTRPHARVGGARRVAGQPPKSQCDFVVYLDVVVRVRSTIPLCSKQVRRRAVLDSHQFSQNILLHTRKLAQQIDSVSEFSTRLLPQLQP